MIPGSILRNSKTNPATIKNSPLFITDLGLNDVENNSTMPITIMKHWAPPGNAPINLETSVKNPSAGTSCVNGVNWLNTCDPTMRNTEIPLTISNSLCLP